jgi:hypothetical protein
VFKWKLVKYLVKSKIEIGGRIGVESEDIDCVTPK